ncbi:MAG: tetratricopeptide repeat protein, partial [Candidatus Aminicenantes bacterium]|nr:tetratricopeptide repeat protein [Candidatus Aminicenantes bacterium]
RVPFEGDTPFTIGVKHKSEHPKNPRELNTQIPEDLSKVILRCLEKDKENRFQSAGELRSELTRIEQGIPTTEREIPKRKPTTSREITVTFSPKKLLIPALVVIVLVIATLIILQLIPQREAVIAQKIENSIAVISFENQTGDDAYDYLQKVIPNLLITNLENTGLLYVVTWERMRDLLKQIGKNNVETIDRDSGFEVCRMEGVEAIVLGFFTKAGNVFHTDIKVLDTETKKILKSHISKGEGIDSILKTQIDELSREISQGIGIPATKIDETQKRIIDVTTSSMEAYNYFLKGINELTKLYFEDALKLFEKAVELDPTFAVAHLFLGVSHEGSGNTKGRNEAFENAKKYSAKTSDKERLWIESIYANYIGRDREKAVDILEQLVEKYPREDIFHHDLGNLYRVGREYKKAIEEFTKALELDPNFGLVMNHMAYTYSAMEEYEKAIEYLQKYSSLSPEDANPLDSMGEIYLIMGNLDESIAKYKEASEKKPGLGSDWKLGYAYALKQDYVKAMKWADKQISRSLAQGSKAIGHWWKGFYHYWLGNTEKALVSIDIAEKMATELENLTLKRAAIWMKGMAHLERGETEASRECIQSWFDLLNKSPSQLAQRHTVYYKFFLGLIDLKEGRIDDAKSKLEQIELLLPEITQSYKARLTAYYNYLKGELLLGEGKVEEIIDLYEAEVIPRGFTTVTYTALAFHNVPFQNDVLARAFAKKGDVDKAIDEYERLVTFDTTRKERRLVHPKYYYRLAKLYQEKGWAGKAIEHYEKFLALWKNADPGIPEVEDAGKRLAGLKSQ